MFPIPIPEEPTEASSKFKPRNPNLPFFPTQYVFFLTCPFVPYSLIFIKLAFLIGRPLLPRPLYRPSFFLCFLCFAFLCHFALLLVDAAAVNTASHAGKRIDISFGPITVPGFKTEPQPTSTKSPRIAPNFFNPVSILSILCVDSLNQSLVRLHVGGDGTRHPCVTYSPGWSRLRSCNAVP